MYTRFWRYITTPNQKIEARKASQTAWVTVRAAVPPPGRKTTSAAIASTITTLRTVLFIRALSLWRRYLLPAAVEVLDRALSLLVAGGGVGASLGARPSGRVGKLVLDRAQGGLGGLDLLLEALLVA